MGFIEVSCHPRVGIELKFVLLLCWFDVACDCSLLLDFNHESSYQRGVWVLLR